MGCNRLCTSEDKEAAQRAEKDHISISEARDRIYVERQEMYADIAASMAGARPGESMADVARRHFEEAHRAQQGGFAVQQQQPTYEAPPPSYQTPQPTYQAPPPSYQTPQPTYEAPPPSYQTPQPTYQAPPPSYQTPQPTYQAPPPSYQTPQPTYEAPPPSYQRDQQRAEREQQERDRKQNAEERVQFSYAFDRVKDYPPLPTNGDPVVFARDTLGRAVGHARTLADGGIAITTCINNGEGPLWGAGRQGYESFLPLGKLIGFAGHARAHAAGQGTGPESPYGIAYAHEVVNEFQNQGVEEDVRRLADQVLPGIRLVQHVEIATDSTGLRLEGVRYQVEAVLPDNSRHVLYQHGLEISGPVNAQRVQLDGEAPQYSPNLEQFLKSARRQQY